MGKFRISFSNPRGRHTPHAIAVNTPVGHWWAVVTTAGRSGTSQIQNLRPLGSPIGTRDRRQQREARRFKAPPPAPHPHRLRTAGLPLRTERAGLPSWPLATSRAEPPSLSLLRRAAYCCSRFLLNNAKRHKNSVRSSPPGVATKDQRTREHDLPFFLRRRRCARPAPAPGHQARDPHRGGELKHPRF
jgi:hypothetical protein